MGFYDLSKSERQKIVYKIENDILQAILDLDNQFYKYEENKMVVPEIILNYSSDNDTYIRKNVYMAVGRIYNDHENLRQKLLLILEMMIDNTEIKVRQTSVYALGEIGKKDAESIIKILEKALIDKHHAVNNAVIGALKQMGQKNPVPTIKFASKHLHDDDPMVRRQIIHGIELRGRNHPNEVLPLLKELQYEENKKVRNMIIHVIGQISYKTGSLEKVIDSLKSWNNRELVCESAEEILNVHARYKFSARSPEDAKKYIEMNIPKLLNGNKN